MPDSLHHYCPTCKDSTELEEIRTATQMVLIEDITEKRGLQYSLSEPVEHAHTVVGYRCVNCHEWLYSGNKIIACPASLIRVLGGNPL